MFVRVVQSGSFSAVAREAGVGQPSVSKQIAQLEAHLGAQLLRRTSRSMTLTEAGQTFYEAAVRLVDDLEAAESLIGRGQTAPSGLIFERNSHQRCLEKILAMMDYEALRREQADLRETGVYRGIGLASFVEIANPGPAFYGVGGAPISAQDGCTLRLDPGGTVTCAISVTEQGQGTETMVAQIVASANGVASQGPVSNRFTLGADLLEDQRYCWRVRANDGQLTSAYSTACFVVSAVNAARVASGLLK